VRNPAQQGAEGGAPRTFGIGFEERGIEELSDGHAEAQAVELSRRLRDVASTEESASASRCTSCVSTADPLRAADRTSAPNSTSGAVRKN
jgi:hypothetical protein